MIPEDVGEADLAASAGRREEGQEEEGTAGSMRGIVPRMRVPTVLDDPGTPPSSGG